jgi:hypothetical protein
MRVLILGGRAPVALDHARRFMAQGASAFVADSIPCRLSGLSRAVVRTCRLPPPRYALREFATELARVIAAEKIDLVLPTCEEVFYLSRVRQRLPSGCNVFVSPLEKLRELHSKLSFLELARGCGVDVPESARVEQLGEAREWANGRPVVLKPEFSRFGVHVRLYSEGIPPDAPQLSQLGPWVVQEYRSGRELCSYGVAVDGVLRAQVTYEPSYRLARSSSYYFEPASVPAIDSFVARFVSRVGYTGQIAFDWILGSDGHPCVLECNPRAISGLHLFSRWDPLPAIIAGERSSPCVTPVNPRPRMLAAIMLTEGLRAALRRGQLHRWRADWNRASDVLGETGDVRPTLGALLDIGSYGWLALRQRCSLRQAATRDIEWDGEALAG